MALSSMTGFARSHGTSGPYAFEWELKSVNAKGFDLRVRLPQGFAELEAHAKKRAGELLSRGTVYANLNVKRTNAAATVRINEDVLNAVLKAAALISGKVDAVAPSIDGLLAIKGVVEFYRDKGDHVITATTEHKAILDTCKALERKGQARVTYLPVDRYGMVDPDDVRRAIGLVVDGSLGLDRLPTRVFPLSQAAQAVSAADAADYLKVLISSHEGGADS